MTGRAQRADASRNRELLLAAAADAFASEGVDASLERIARTAGVGIGTLYRHFPTRDALVEAVFRRNVDVLCATAEELSAELPPEEALSAWIQQLVTYVAGKRGLATYLKSVVATDSDLFESTHRKVLRTVEALVAAAAAAGVIRTDVDAADLMRAVGGICVMADQPDDGSQARRLAALLMDGMRYPAQSGAPA